MTDYNTNESSNMDQYSYRWKESSSKKEEVPLFSFDNNHCEGGVFDFPFTQVNPPESHARDMNSPKKKQRLLCNSKKVPHWAENNQVSLI